VADEVLGGESGHGFFLKRKWKGERNREHPGPLRS
jgi:hypothetical protein